MAFQFGPTLCGKAFPGIFFGYGQFPIVWRFAELIGHLQEEEIGELFQIIAIAHAVIAQGVAEAPDFADDAGGSVCLVGQDVFSLYEMLIQKISLSNTHQVA